MSVILYLGLGLAVLTSISIIFCSIYLFYLRNKEIIKEIKSELLADQQKELDLKELVSTNISDRQNMEPIFEVDKPLNIDNFEFITRTNLVTHGRLVFDVIKSGSEILSKGAKYPSNVNVLRNINQNALNRTPATEYFTPQFSFTDTKAFIRSKA